MTSDFMITGIASWLVVQVVYEIVLISCAYAGLHYGFKDILGEHVKCFCKCLFVSNH